MKHLSITENNDSKSLMNELKNKKYINTLRESTPIEKRQNRALIVIFLASNLLLIKIL